MVTKQFTKYLANQTCKSISNADVTPASANVSTVLYGTTYSYKSTSAKWLDVGFGDADEEPDQYALASSNASAGTLTCESQASETKASEDIFAVSAVFTNSSGASVTVKEIGLFAGSVGSTTSAYTDCVMFARLKLDNPVTIANGEAKAFALHVGLED